MAIATAICPMAPLVQISSVCHSPWTYRFFAKTGRIESSQPHSASAAQKTRRKRKLHRRLNSRLDAEYAQIIDLDRRIELYERQILSLAEGHAQAALVAYQSDTGDFADVMRGYIDDLNTRVDHIRLQVERAQSYTTLANLGGLSR